MSEYDVNQHTPFREGEYPSFVSSENGCSHIGNNPDKNHMRQFKVDGEIFLKGTKEPRCDYLLVNDTAYTSYYIELKGSDIPKAIEQIENTISQLSPSLKNYQIFCRIVYRTGSHKVQDAKVLRWKRKHKGHAKIESRKIEEVLSQPISNRS
jgi:hypothetical protein